MTVFIFVPCIVCVSVERNVKRRQVKPLAASLLDALDYDSSDDSDFEVGDASGTHRSVSTQNLLFCLGHLKQLVSSLFHPASLAYECGLISLVNFELYVHVSE